MGTHCLLFNPEMSAVRLLETKSAVSCSIIRNVIRERFYNLFCILVITPNHRDVYYKVVFGRVGD